MGFEPTNFPFILVLRWEKLPFELALIGYVPDSGVWIINLFLSKIYLRLWFFSFVSGRNILPKLMCSHKRVMKTM